MNVAHDDKAARKSFINVNRMAISQGGTYAGEIEPGDSVGTHNGVKVVEDTHRFRSEGADMIALIFADDFQALMPIGTDVQVVDVRPTPGVRVDGPETAYGGLIGQQPY